MWTRWLLAVLLVLGGLLPAAGARERMGSPVGELAPVGEVAVSELPREARDTLALIRRGGPYRYDKDGTPFGNREGFLPRKPRGYYTEYTVMTPGARDRGARRIVAGGDPRVSSELYYTQDHYRSFRRIRE